MRENVAVYMPRDIHGLTVCALLAMPGAGVINNPFSFVSIFLNVTI